MSLREVQYKLYKFEDKERVEDIKYGYFHAFMNDPDNNICAIVEDGETHEVLELSTTRIKFLDKPEINQTGEHK